MIFSSMCFISFLEKLLSSIQELSKWPDQLFEIRSRCRSFLTLLAEFRGAGQRIEEALGLHRAHIDFDNFLLSITGKGDKQRVIPFSNELRKILFRWCGHHRHDVVFPTLDGGKLGRRVVLRDFKILCRRLKFDLLPGRSTPSVTHSRRTTSGAVAPNSC